MINLERRYQVFVSSTYLDLREARGEIMQALLELNCMPAGMELFPAANEDQWNWIKRVIEESDYYLVVLAGRYGSVSPKTNLSYTEMEYRYALELGKPVIGFVHEDPKQLPAKHYENDPVQREKLNEFRKLVQSKLCKHWSTPTDLGAKVSRSLTQLTGQYPAVGWVRANSITTEAANEALGLRKQIEELKAKLEQVVAHGPAGSESLAQGADSFKINYSFERQKSKTGKSGQLYWVKAGEEVSSVKVTWDELFAHLATSLIVPVSDYKLVEQLNHLVEFKTSDVLARKYPDERVQSLRIGKESYDVIKVQFRALGLIGLSGEAETWILTEYGNRYMNTLLAVQRKI